MPVQKIKSGRIITVQAATYVGDKGIIFYDEDTPELRLSDGITPGGIPFTGGGGTGTFILQTATNVRLGGVKIGANVNITSDGTISVAAPFSGSYNDLTDKPTPYTLPTASTSTLGGIKIGSGLSIDGSGVLSAVATSTYVLTTATASVLGGVKIGANVNITSDGTISVAAPFSGSYNDLTDKPLPYVLPTASTSTLGGIKIGSGLSIDGSGVVSAIATSTYVLTTATASALGGVKIGANINITSDGTISVAAPYTLPTASTSTLGGIKVGSGLTINGSGVLNAVVTATYTLPIASSSVLGGIKIGQNLSISPDGTLNANTATSGGSGDSFSTIVIEGSTNLLASGADVLEFIAGQGVSISSSSTSVPYKSITIDAASYLGNIDGGWPDSDYGGILSIDAGTPFDIYYDGQAIEGGGI